MGKVANAKRKRFFDKLLQEDIERQARIDMPRKYPNCCLNKYANKMPSHFVKCFNCPLDTEDEVA
jgi:hypothetical protein